MCSSSGGQNCINTASGIVLSVSDRPVCRFLLNLHTGRSLTQNTIPDAVLIQCDLLMISAVLLETCLYMFRAHVLIVRREKLYYTVSGIITPIGGRPVHRLREDMCSKHVEA